MTTLWSILYSRKWWQMFSAARGLVVIVLILGSGHLRSGELPVTVSKGAYKHFEVTSDLKKKFAANDALKMEVRHLGSEQAKMFVTFEDNKSDNYWSRLNFKSTLFPGKNVLYFDLSQKVGQKGSEGGRPLDSKNLKKFYIIVDPDNEAKQSFKVSVRKIQFQKTKRPSVPKKVYLYNFKGSDQEYAPLSGEKVADELTKFKKGGFGFEKIDLWRAEDAQIRPRRMSTSLGLINGDFSVELPNGAYEFELVWDHLGYWDAPFWKGRKLRVNGQLVRIDGRGTVRDFLKDYLSLMDEPAYGEDLYKFYLSKIFLPVKGEVIVKNKKATFSFEGDPSGVSLNSLLIYPKGHKEASKFKKELEDFEAMEFSKYYRKVGKDKKKFKKLSARAISPGSRMRAGGDCPKEIEAHHLGASHFEGFLNLCVELPNNSPVTYSFMGNGKERFQLEEYLYRPKSVDLNHETYILRGEDLRPLEHPSFEPNGHSKRYFRVAKKKGLPTGEMKGQIVFEQDGQKAAFSFSFTNIKGDYDLSAYNAGFLGLSPFPLTNFSGQGTEEARASYALKAMKELEEHGMNLFTDYPAPSVEYAGATRSTFKLNTEAFDRMASKTNSKELLFYNGEFPKTLFSGHQRNAGQSEESYWDNMKDELMKLTSYHAGKSFVYLYSDEASGYRNAVKEDMELLKKYQGLFPKLKMGGFGNLHTWDKAKELYQKWDYGLYSEMPSAKDLKKLRDLGQDVGVYNLCAAPEENLFWCFGPQLYMLKSAGLNRYLEWHASAVHNYPGLDLDGRESDIAMFYPNLDGGLVRTSRFMKAIAGMELALKLDLLEKVAGERPKEAKELKLWLKNLKAVEAFPIQNLKSNYQDQTMKVSQRADFFLRKFF